MSETLPPPSRAGETDEDILCIPQDDFVMAASHAPAPPQQPVVLDDVFPPSQFPPAGDVRREAPGSAPHPFPPSASPDTPEAVSAVLTQVRAESQSRQLNAAETVDNHSTETPGVIAAAAPDAELNRPRAMRTADAPKPDKYAVGMRLLRISPAWLLLSSIGFFLVIFLLSRLDQPAVQPVEATAAPVNHSANLSVAPDAASAFESERAAQARSGARTIETKPQAAETIPQAVEPKPQAGEVKQPVEANPLEARPVVASEATAAQAMKQTPVATASQQTAKPSAQGGRFVVQVNSFSNLSEANERVSRLRAAGFEARTAAAEIPGRGTWHRVYVGGFDTRAEAARFADHLRAKGVASGLVVEVK